jgi:hypothetical protein
MAMSLSNSVQPGTPEHFRREWRTQRVLWCLGVALLAASAAGALGPGFLSNRRLQRGALSTSYERFVHRHHPTPLRISVDRAVTKETLVIELAGELVDATRVEAIHPRPLRETKRGQAIAYEFGVEPSASGATVLFYLDYEHLGAVHGRVACEGHVLEFSQFVYP